MAWYFNVYITASQGFSGGNWIKPRHSIARGKTFPRKSFVISTIYMNSAFVKSNLNPRRQLLTMKQLTPLIGGIMLIALIAGCILPPSVATRAIRNDTWEPAKEDLSNIIIEGSYRYYQGEKRYMNLSSLIFTLRFATNIPDEQKETILGSFDVALYNPTLLHNHDLALAKLNRPTVDIVQLLHRISSVPEVEFATPVFVQGTDFPTDVLYMTDEFVAQFRPDLQEDEILQINNQYHVETVRVEHSNDPETRWHVLRVTKSSGKNAQETANVYVESGLVVWAEPNFVGFVSLHEAFGT